MKKQTLINYILLTILVLILIFLIFIFIKSFSKEDTSLTSKTEDEIGYLEDKVIAMMNYLNSIQFSNSVLIEEKQEESKENSQEESSQTSSKNEETGKSSSKSSSSSENSDSSSKSSIKYEIQNSSILSNSNKNIDWQYIKSNTETIYSTWPTVVVDLHELNVNNEDILNFSNTLDQVTLSIKEENKEVTINNLASLYAFFPNYRKQISKDTKKINIDYTKNCLLNAYALVEQGKWDEIKVQTQSAITYFSNIMNSIEKSKEKQNSISKIYVLLNELNNSVDKKDKDLFYIQYRNAMEELMNQ